MATKSLENSKLSSDFIYYVNNLQFKNFSEIILAYPVYEKIPCKFPPEIHMAAKIHKSKLVEI